MFISSIYDSNWDTLFTNNKTNTLRKKIASRFTPRLQSTLHRNPKEVNKPPPLILAKSQKKINIISKFFKNKNLENSTPAKTKFYVQVSKQNASMSDVIKIKETFLSIGVEKIDKINDIVKRTLK